MTDRAAGGARMGAPISDEREVQVARLRQYLVPNVPIAFVLAAVFTGLAWAYDTRWPLIAASCAWLMGLVYLWALRALRRNRYETAVAAICGGMALLPLASILIGSQAYAVAAVLTLWPVAIAMSYLERTHLRFVMLASVTVGLLAAGLALRPPTDVGLPVAGVRAIIIGVTSVMSALILYLFWQHNSRLSDINAALRASERALAERLAELSRSQAALAQARDQALRATEAKSAFLANVSHELRTPLTSVLGFSKLIKKRLADTVFPAVRDPDAKIQRAMDQVRGNVDIIASEGERLTKLIGDVLDLAKIEAGKVEWHMAPTAVAGVIEQAVAATASLFEGKPIELRVDVESGLPSVEGDRDRLIQVMVNLISNAVKFTREGSVMCRARRDDGYLEVSVVDTGIGIAEEDCERVFEQFVQVGNELSDKPQGTGLGLPICKEIVEHHGGRIWVESGRGRGTTVLFTLPLVKDAQAPVASAVRSIAQAKSVESLVAQLRALGSRQTSSHTGRTDILVVDDDPAIRELLRQELEAEGYVVREACDGNAAVAEVRRARPDLIILDVMMPGLSGFDVAAVVRSDPAFFDVPIFILSVLQDAERGYRLGVDRYFTKPLDSRALVEEVRVWMARGASRKRVLVIDQDAATVRALSDALAAQGYTVAAARSAPEGIEKAIADRPDLVVVRSLLSEKYDLIKTLRFEKGLEQVYFLLFE